MSDPEQPVQPEEIPSTTPTPLSPLWRWVTVGILLLGLVLTVLFAMRATRSFRTFHNERGRPPREATGNIAPWMTVPYVAHAYGVPEPFLYAQLGIEAEGNERKTLMQIERSHFNGERGLLRDRILAALELYYTGSTVPTPIVPGPGDVPMPEALPPNQAGEHGVPGGPDAPPDAPTPETLPDPGGVP